MCFEATGTVASSVEGKFQSLRMEVSGRDKAQGLIGPGTHRPPAMTGEEAEIFLHMRLFSRTGTAHLYLRPFLPLASISTASSSNPRPLRVLIANHNHFTSQPNHKYLTDGVFFALPSIFRLL